MPRTRSADASSTSDSLQAVGTRLLRMFTPLMNGLDTIDMTVSFAKSSYPLKFSPSVIMRLINNRLALNVEGEIH
jgi:hypothetical protein